MDKVLQQKELHPELVDRALALQLYCKYVLGIAILYCQGFRSKAYQAQLYSVGRTTQKDRAPVTNAPPGNSYHEYGLALDFTVLIEGKAAWERKDLFKIVGESAKMFGLSWAGKFKNDVAKWDLGHLEKNFGLTIPDLKKGKKPC